MRVQTPTFIPQKNDPMNKMILAACAALFAASFTATAQTTATPVGTEATPQKGVKEETRAASGQLKEAYGAVSQQYALLSKEAGTAATAEQTAQLNTLKTSLAELESMLTAVNTATEANWPEVKVKAEAARTAALKLVAERKQEAK